VIALPITPLILQTEIIIPAMRLLPVPMDSLRARLLLGATAMQESGLAVRDQTDAGHVIGPALGLWQCERGGAIANVLENPATSAIVRKLMDAHGMLPTRQALWIGVAQDDLLAACVARLEYWTRQPPLPVEGDMDGAWTYYLATWRPGRPDKSRWRHAYQGAMYATGVTHEPPT
jgi:hypothetical protein